MILIPTYKYGTKDTSMRIINAAHITDVHVINYERSLKMGRNPKGCRIWYETRDEDNQPIWDETPFTMEEMIQAINFWYHHRQLPNFASDLFS